jgi:hypothetical protein
MVRNITVAAAVASVLASGAAMAQLQPTPAQAASPTVGLYVAGSSAAKNAILGALETGSSFCGGTYSLFSSTGDTNFFAVSCAPTAATGLPGANGTNVFTIWYRDEGGSVVGSLPLVSGSQINQLSLAGASGSAGSYTVAVAGASATNGIDDSFASGVFKAPVQAGVVDQEPTVYTGANYPSAYKTSVYGHASTAQLAGLTQTPTFDLVYGVLVNTNSSAFSSAEKSGQGTTTASLDLSRQTIGAILQGNQVNWNDVPDTSGNAVTAASLPITIINREQGAGVRAAVDLFFTGDHCTTPLQTPIQESTGGTADYFAMKDVLTAANTIPGAITYATIDYAGSAYPNLTLVAVDGVQPSNLNAAAGTYGVWYEAEVTTGANYSSLSAAQQGLIQGLITAFQTEASVPGAISVLANPNYNTPSYPISSTAAVVSGVTVYVNPFSRLGNSCNDPVPFL